MAELLNHSRSGINISLDGLVSALWCSLFPGQDFGQNHELDGIFARMNHSPELATQELCPYYFDQVTHSLPTRDQVKHRENCNLRLHWFDSWADLKQERQRAVEQKGRLQLRIKRGAVPRTGIHLNRLCQVQDSNAGGAISTKEYIYLMYGFRI